MVGGMKLRATYALGIFGLLHSCSGIFLSTYLANRTCTKTHQEATNYEVHKARTSILGGRIANTHPELPDSPSVGRAEALRHAPARGPCTLHPHSLVATSREFPQRDKKNRHSPWSIFKGPTP